jgi:hypothetical protein
VTVKRGTSTVKTLTAAASATSLNVTGLINGVTYTFTATAKNAIGASAASAVETATPATVPGAPRLGVSTPGNTTVIVRWTAPTAIGGSALTGFVVKAFRGSLLVASVTPPQGVADATFTGLTNGLGYTFTAAATNGVGTGTAARTPLVTPRTTPDAPVIGTATAGNASVLVRWTAPATGGSAITGYVVQAYDGATLVKTVNASASLRSATVSGLVNGTAYTFTVTAKNVAGLGPASAASTAATPATKPGAPVIGTPTAGNASATVTWAAPASNGGSAITGYTVRAYRGTTLVKTLIVAAPATSTTVTGLVNGVAHTFTVTATNAAGTSVASARSVAVTPRV